MKKKKTLITRRQALAAGAGAMGALLLPGCKQKLPPTYGNILRMGDMLLVKRLQALPGGQVKVTSDNPAFDPWLLNIQEIGADVAIIGRVVWSGRRL